MSHDLDRSNSPPRGRMLKRSRGASALPAAPEPHALELEACDRIDVANHETMVRVAGRWTPGAPAEVALQTGDQILLPLPPGPTTGPDGLWRAAFAINAADNASPIALLTDSGTRVELAGTQPPAPQPAPEAEPAPQPETEPVPQPVAEPAPLPDIAAQRNPDLEEKLADALDDLA